MAVSENIISTGCLSPDRVNGTYDDDLILCPICTNILWKPVACKTCENSFCDHCIRLWLNEKPNQCPFNCRFQERKPPGILLKLLTKLNVDCENKSNGCEMIIPYEALDKHQVKECEYRLMECPHCLEKIFFKDYTNHCKGHCSLFIDPFKQQVLAADKHLTPAPSQTDFPVDFRFTQTRDKKGDHVPHGYAGFHWENAYYIFKDYVQENYRLKGFLKAFTDSIQCVVYNGNGNPLSIYLPNATSGFNVHSFSALSVYHESMKMSITGFRFNVPKITKQLVLSRASPKLFQINLEHIDKITFLPTDIDCETMKNQTFCLISLHFLL